jgi:hypothetical protein
LDEGPQYGQHTGAASLPSEPTMTQSDEYMSEGEVKALPAVGYKRPPVHTRFNPGQSGNPSGRAKGCQNLQTLFKKILNEQISLREGLRVRKVSKAEAVLRGLVIGALKGEARSVDTVFRLAEKIGQFEQKNEQQASITEIRRIIVGWKSDLPDTEESVA